MVGQTVSHYRILEKLGAGGMGVVYKAEDTKLGRSVALKFLAEELCEDRQALKRFQREARAASSLNHPHICVVLDIDEHEGKPFIAMELLDGEPLDHRIGGRPLPVDEVLDVGIQVSEALEAAHAKGIIHRDIKPSNVFVGEQSMAKVLDFGLAKMQKPAGDLTASTSLTEQDALLGTVPYMAPEQLRSEAVDARTDLHALGAVLYEMATGRRAFTETLGPPLVDAILHELPVSPRAFNPKVPPELERIILKCLEKAPQNRYQSGKELAVDLRHLKRETEAPVAALYERRLLEEKKAPAVSAARTPPLQRRPAVLTGGALLVLVVAVLALNVAGLRDRLLSALGVGPSTSPAAATAKIQSLAVLPLENLSGDPEQEYFSDGMHEELIATLSKISALKVISRTSAMRYRGSDKRLPEIARELGVDGIIEGSVRRAGDEVRITVQLVEAATDQHLWTESYQRDLRDILALQSEVAQAIAREIQTAVTPEEQTRLASTLPVNPKAHEAYLKGRFFFNKLTKDDLLKAIEYAQQAIETDPEYAPAYGLLASSYWESSETSFGDLPDREAAEKTRAAAMKALELDDSLAEAHVGLGSVLNRNDWDWAGAEREFKRAIELNPNFGRAHAMYAWHLILVGRHDEAVREAKRALELDPFSAHTYLTVAAAHHHRQEYDESLEYAQRFLEMFPNSTGPYRRLWVAFEAKGMYDEAVAARQKEMALRGEKAEDVAALGHAYKVGGIRGVWRWDLERLKERSARGKDVCGDLATTYALLGEKDKAFEWLEKGYQQRSHGMAFIRGHPAYDSLRSDPRFQALLRRMNFPD